MAELRQRRGEQEGQDNGTEVEEVKPAHQGPAQITYVKRKEDRLYMAGGSNFKTLVLEDIIRMSVVAKSKAKMKSASNATQEVKDELQQDPYNIDLILKLGLRYMDQEYQYDLATNVLLRGFKRVSELKDSNERYLFLSKLCEASFRNLQFKQAHAVFMDMEEPDGGYERKAHLLLGCNVFAYVGDAAKALGCFCKLVEAEDFEVAIGFWAATALSLRKVGAFEASKTSMTSKVRSGNHHHRDEERMQMVQSWTNMSLHQEEGKSVMELCAEGRPPKKVIRGACAVFVMLILYMFYAIEQHSLRRHKLA